MLLYDILAVSFIVVSVILTINFWLLIGFIIVSVFEDFDMEEIDYYEALTMSASWPLSVMMMIAKQLHIKEKD